MIAAYQPCSWAFPRRGDGQCPRRRGRSASGRCSFETLRLGGDEAFAELVAPVAVAVNLSYVAARAGYYDPIPAETATPRRVDQGRARGGPGRRRRARCVAWLRRARSARSSPSAGPTSDPAAVGRTFVDARRHAAALPRPGRERPRGARASSTRREIDYFARASDFRARVRGVSAPAAAACCARPCDSAPRCRRRSSRSTAAVATATCPRSPFRGAASPAAARNRTACDAGGASSTARRRRAARLNPSATRLRRPAGATRRRRAGGACVWRAQADEPRACADAGCGGGATCLACERCLRAGADVFAVRSAAHRRGERPTMRAGNRAAGAFGSRGGCPIPGLLKASSRRGAAARLNAVRRFRGKRAMAARHEHVPL